MKDYASMSDFEINSSVSVAAGLEHVMFFDVDSDICSGPVWELPSGKYVDYQVKKGCAFDPCNNPADAWLILLENHIAIAPYKNATPCAWPSAEGLISKHVTEDANPLRAGMITFLKMKENQND